MTSQSSTKTPTQACAICSAPVEQKPKGRPRFYCSEDCVRVAEARAKRITPPAAPQEHWCPSCRTRYRYPLPRDTYESSSMTKAQYRWLVNAARVWDAMGVDGMTAAEFIAWLRPDVLAFGHLRVPEFDGAKPRSEGTRIHRHPDPIPYAPLGRRVA